MHPDKGMGVLREALAVVGRDSVPRVVVLLAGRDEGANLGWETHDQMDIRHLGHVEDVPSLLRAADVLALPTQREGFPNVVLEAAAAGLPTVTTDATGAVDSVVDGCTGYVVNKTDGFAFGEALVRLVNDRELRIQQGAVARRRVETTFPREMIWEGMYREYLGDAANASGCTGKGSDDN
jgi:glycosyltransferase involved in cell wall biosynthesis